MKKSTKGVIGIIAGVAIATASAIIMGAKAKSKNDNNDEFDFTGCDSSEDSIVEVED